MSSDANGLVPPAASSPSEKEYSEAYAIVEVVLGYNFGPSLGLRLHGANLRNLVSFNQRVGLGDISVTMLAILCMLERMPGLSQAELARLIKVERMTAGINVKRCVEMDLVMREAVPSDRRKYSLSLTDSGLQMLDCLRERMPVHEDRLAARLTQSERSQLIKLLDKVGHD